MSRNCVHAGCNPGTLAATWTAAKKRVFVCRFLRMCRCTILAASSAYSHDRQQKQYTAPLPTDELLVVANEAISADTAEEKVPADFRFPSRPVADSCEQRALDSCRARAEVDPLRAMVLRKLQRTKPTAVVEFVVRRKRYITTAETTLST